MKWELLEDDRSVDVDRSVSAVPAPHEIPQRPLSSDSSHRDLELVEQLLDRCWREIDSSDLNVKLTDLVRLLEFKEKLRPAVEAQKTFWAMVDQMRREELAQFSDGCPDEPRPPTDEDDSTNDSGHHATEDHE
ncbi:MAG: hypothetical protein AB1792_11145 [Candidatus Zixiibacteriota bacterium]